MKITSAWFLLLLSVAQWVGGHLCFEVTYWMEAQRLMSAEEKALAEMVQQKTGVESTVRVLAEGELMPRGNFYGDFVFSKTTKTGMVFYTVENETASVSYTFVSKIPEKENPATGTNPIKALKGLFKDFTIPATEWPVAPATKDPVFIFYYAAPCSFAFTPQLFHPPAQA